MIGGFDNGVTWPGEVLTSSGLFMFALFCVLEISRDGSVVESGVPTGWGLLGTELEFWMLDNKIGD